MEEQRSLSPHSFIEPQIDSSVELYEPPHISWSSDAEVAKGSPTDEEPTEFIPMVSQEQEFDQESETDIQIREEARKCGLLKIKIPRRQAKASHASNKPISVDEGSDSDVAGAYSNGPPKTQRKGRKQTRKAAEKAARHSKKHRAKPRGRPPKPPPVPVSRFTASVFVEIAQHPVFEAGKTRKGDKMVKQDPLTKGPFTLTQDMSWKKLLREIASEARVDKENIPLEAMTWSHKKQALPLTSELGFTTMIQQIKAMKEPDSAIIVIGLPPLRSSRQKRKGKEGKKSKKRKRDVVSDSESWSENEGLAFGDGCELEGTTWGKKESLDKQLAPVVEKLQRRYPVGECDVHPKIRCFCLKKNNWHFELDSNRLNVWAAAIIKNETDYVRVPLASKFFSPKMRLNAEPSPNNERKHLSPGPSNLAHAPPPSSWGHSYPTYSHPMVGPYPPAPPPNFYAFGAAENYAQALPSGAWGQPSTPMRNLYHPNRSSTRERAHYSSPVRIPPLLATWCQQHDLGEEELQGLAEMGFRVGDDLADLDASMWQSVGLGPLHQRRILKACASTVQ